MTSTQIANFWRSEVPPESWDEAMALLRELNAEYRTGEPGLAIHAIHLEPPNVIWMYALFDDQAALDEHRRRNKQNPKFHAFRALIPGVEATHETTPLFAKGLDFDQA